MELRKYIFYTNEGFTQDTDCNDIENCQILGWANGINSNIAFENLLAENEYIKHADYDEIISLELKNNKQHFFSLKDTTKRFS